MRSQSQPTFDPTSIPQFSVIAVPYAFPDDPEPLLKRFVVICHKDNHAFCIKATSNVFLYRGDPRMLAGCVFYRANEVPFFECDTVIQPDNQVAISHERIKEYELRKQFAVLGVLPDDFAGRLRAAANNSVLIEPLKKERLLKYL